jgi:hypothetical protein
VEALKEKERQDETQFTTKIDGFLSFIPLHIDGFLSFIPPPHLRWMLMYFFWQVIFESHPIVYDQTQGSGAVFFLYFTDNSIQLPVLNQLVARTRHHWDPSSLHLCCLSITLLTSEVFLKDWNFLAGNGWGGGWRRHKSFVCSWWSRGGDEAAHVTQLVVSMYMKMMMMMMVPFRIIFTLSWSNRQTPSPCISSFMSKKLSEDIDNFTQHTLLHSQDCTLLVWNESAEGMTEPNNSSSYL